MPVPIISVKIEKGLSPKPLDQGFVETQNKDRKNTIETNIQIYKELSVNPAYRNLSLGEKTY